jgi:alkanesulfonate monooxygenase SsuD/methylene tetrahydromethanopterin reductase-like flavin-dependent oxidoreductase (luciferase family)
VRLWTETEPITFEGSFWKGVDLIVEPRPLQKPYPELWWAGDAEVSVARAARVAHWLELTWPVPAKARERAQRLSELVAEKPLKHPRKVGTAVLAFAEVRNSDYTAEEFSRAYRYAVHNDALLGSVIAGSPETCAEVIHQFADAGVTHLALDFNRHGEDSVKRVHDQMEQFAARVVPLI